MWPPRLHYNAWNETYTVENGNENLLFSSSVLPGPDIIVSVRDSIDPVLFTISANKKDKKKKYEYYSQLTGNLNCTLLWSDCGQTRHTNVFPRKGEKQYTMSVLSVLNMPWPQSKSNINDDSTQQCNSSICVYACSVHKNPKSNIDFNFSYDHSIRILLPYVMPSESDVRLM